VARTAIGAKAQPTNRINNRRPNLLLSGVDGKVTFKPGCGRDAAK
jgi:hypothetical protein